MNSTTRDYIDELDALLDDTSGGSEPLVSDALLGFHMLVALTDDDRAAATTEVARALKEHKDAVPSVVYVIEVSASVPEATLVTVELEDELRNVEQRAVTEARMKTVLHLDVGDEATWPFKIEVGNVADVVTERAKTQGAELIVMGLNRHAAVSRAIGRDTVRQVMGVAGVPVLAVRDSLLGLPKRVVAAVDFSRASIRAAGLARRLIADGGEMHLLFVDPGVVDSGSESSDGARLIKSKGVDAALSELRDVLESDGKVTIHTTVLHNGNPAAEIIRFCEKLSPDLVTIGSQRHRFLDRMLLGSTARAIAATGKWSVLVTPPLRAP